MAFRSTPPLVKRFALRVRTPRAPEWRTLARFITREQADASRDRWMVEACESSRARVVSDRYVVR